MPELDALREAEEYAAKVIEQAGRDAQKTRLGIASRIEAMDGEKDQKLRAVEAQAQAAVDGEMKNLGAELDARAAERLALLEARREAVGEAALELLRQRILAGGDRD